MSIPRVGPCSDWTTLDEVRAMPGAGESLPANTQVTDAIVFASNWLFVKSGRQFPGTCTSTVRPTSREASSTSRWRHADWGSCGCSGGCCTAGGRAVTLGEFPVTAITGVLVDGATVDPGTYHVERWRTLVRHGRSWPTCQNLDLASTELDTFEVTFQHGQPVPPDGRKAASALAYELAKAWRGDQECKLNERVTQVSRDGYSMTLIAPGDLLKADGSTGVKEVDLFLSARNPNRLQGRARVASPDIGRSTGGR